LEIFDDAEKINETMRSGAAQNARLAAEDAALDMGRFIDGSYLAAAR